MGEVSEKLCLDEIAHIGIYVKDLEKTLKDYENYFGIVPIRTGIFKTEQAVIRGKPAKFTLKTAFAKFGQTQLELLEVIDSDPPEFLGGRVGLVHIAFRVPDRDKEAAKYVDKGFEIMSKVFDRPKCGIYIDTIKTAGIIFELQP
jgi:catechol 2,3-dioxygenase-like lactoylglutathione lyase family enzyme